jgi:hypothetical protein
MTNKEFTLEELITKQQEAKISRLVKNAENIAKITQRVDAAQGAEKVRLSALLELHKGHTNELESIDVVAIATEKMFKRPIPTPNVLDENINQTYQLGRQYVPDERDNKYPINNLLSVAPVRITNKYWDANGWWGNQGNTPQCVGYAWAHWLEDGPVPQSGIGPIIPPKVIYENAQRVDEWAGENYDGTSVRGGVKYLQSVGKVSSYYWGFNLTTLINSVLNLGPVVVGTNWYNGMFYPNRNGLIKISGRIAGGHAYVINGVNTVTKLFRIKNSWGQSWGQSGHAYISFTDMQRLIRERGEICFATEIRS